MRHTRKSETEPVASAVEQTRRLMDATYEGMFIHDSGVVLDANSAAASLFGRAVRELNHCRLSELIAEESCRALMRKIHKRNTEPCPVTGVRKDGRNVPLEVKVKAVLTCQGRQIEIIVVSEMDGSQN
jgi:PAS domain S-box-containing protein